MFIITSPATEDEVKEQESQKIKDQTEKAQKQQGGENGVKDQGSAKTHNSSGVTTQKSSTSELFNNKAKSYARSRATDEDIKETAEASGLGEAVFSGVREDEDRKKVKELLRSKQVEKELAQKKITIEESLKKSRESFKIWAGLSDEEIKKKFGAFATQFFIIYPESPLDKFDPEAAKNLQSIMDNDLGYYRVYAFDVEEFRITPYGERCTARR